MTWVDSNCKNETSEVQLLEPLPLQLKLGCRTKLFRQQKEPKASQRTSINFCSWAQEKWSWLESPTNEWKNWTSDYQIWTGKRISAKVTLIPANSWLLEPPERSLGAYALLKGVIWRKKTHNFQSETNWKLWRIYSSYGSYDHQFAAMLEKLTTGVAGVQSHRGWSERLHCKLESELWEHKQSKLEQLSILFSGRLAKTRHFFSKSKQITKDCIRQYLDELEGQRSKDIADELSGI